MNPNRVLKLILPHTAFMRTLKARPIENILQEIKNLRPVRNVGEEAEMFVMEQPTRFKQFFRHNYTPALEDMGCMSGVGEQKWYLLEQLCSRNGLKVKDIGSIARYDTETVKFIQELPDEKLLKLRDFIRMKDPHCEYFQAVPIH